MTRKNSVVVKEVSPRSESESEYESDSPVEKPKPKRRYEMTPAREEAIKKMIEARQKKAKEARVNKELNKIETTETKIKTKKEKLKKYKESNDYIPPKPKTKPQFVLSTNKGSAKALSQKKLVEIVSESEEEQEQEQEPVKRITVKSKVERIKPQPKVRHNHREREYEYAPARVEYIFM